MPRSRPKNGSARQTTKPKSATREAVRIIGGSMRGRRLAYDPREGIRPMKHRVREAIFNLVGPSIRETHAIDLFAGSGALGLEAISRGARSATLVERHVGTARCICENARMLDIEDRTDVVNASVFTWAAQPMNLSHHHADSPPRLKNDLVKGSFGTGSRDLPTTLPWVVFCSPPYALYVEQTGELVELITGLLDQAPPESTLVVEADHRFDFDQLPRPEQWDVRIYRPAHVGILRTGSE